MQGVQFSVTLHLPLTSSLGAVFGCACKKSRSLSALSTLAHVCPYLLYNIHSAPRRLKLP